MMLNDELASISDELTVLLLASQSGSKDQNVTACAV